MERFWRWMAWRLPRSLVYWAAVRVGAVATTGPHVHTVVPDLTFVEALKRF